MQAFRPRSVLAPIAAFLARNVPASSPGLVAYLAGSAGLALMLHGAALSWPFAAAYELTTWMPVGYLVQASLLALLTSRDARAMSRRRLAFLVDLSAWAPPFLLLVGFRLGVSAPSVWLAVAIFTKLASGLLAVWCALGSQVPEWRAVWAATAIIAGFFVLAIPFTRLAPPTAVGVTGDEPHYLVMTVSLLRDHDLWVDDEYRDGAYRPFYPTQLSGGDQTLPARGNHLASMHDEGLAILQTLPYALGGWVAVLVAMGVAAALMLRETYLTARLAGAGPEASLLTVALLAACLPLAVYATQDFTEVPIALATSIALRRLWLAGVSPRLASAVTFGVAVAALPWLHVRAWPLALVLLAFGLIVWKPIAARSAAVVPLVVGASAYVVLNQNVFGRLILAPQFAAVTLSNTAKPTASQVLLTVTARPWLDPYDGLLLICPLFFLSLAAIPIAVRRSVPGAAAVLALLVYSGEIGGWYLISGPGTGPPGRFMAPTIPLLAVLMAMAIHHLAKRPDCLAAILFSGGGWSVACSFLLFADRRLGYAVNQDSGPALFYADLWHLPLRWLIPAFQGPALGPFLRVSLVLAVVAILALIIESSRPVPERDREQTPEPGA